MSNLLFFKQKKSYRVVIVVLTVIFGVGCSDFRHIRLSTQAQQQVEQLLMDSPTRCFGTYVIDLPSVFKPSKTMLFFYRNGDVEMSTSPQYLPPFKQMIMLREQELRETNPVDPIDGDYLKAIYPVQTNNAEKMQGVIFERMEKISKSDAARILEGYRWQDNVTLKIEMKARNGLAEQYDEKRRRSPTLYGNNVPEKLSQMHQLFDRIQVRDDLTIPTEPGVCLLRSFMQGMDEDWKDLGYSYSHESIKDFYFRLESDDYADSYALLDKSEAYFTDDRGHTIYKGTRESNGLKLEEWVVKGRFFSDEDGFYSEDMGYLFALGIHMTDPTYKTPKLLLEMYYRIPRDGSEVYSEEQLMVIWREITNSIKMRPGAF